MAKSQRRWPHIVAGLAILVAFLAVGGIFAVVTWVRESVDITETTGEDATGAFDKVRAQFGGRMPLLEVTDRGKPRYAAQTVDEVPGRKLETLHVLAWDPDEGKLARVSLPFWFLRLKSSPIEFSAHASGLDDEGVSLRAEDIEKYGPGVILDHSTPSGERVLLWAQ
jgi:hypothetical protein